MNTHGDVRFFVNVQKAYFLDRPNRFTVRCLREGRVLQAYLPNPGRLQELLLPGSLVYIEENEYSPGRKNTYTLVGVKKGMSSVMLHTHRTNDVARYLIEHRLIEPLKDAKIVSAEVTFAKSRFDFLLEQENNPFYLEVKSCTLFGKKIAMFPDAPTKRGERHLRELAAMGREGIRTAVLIIVHYQDAQFFMPDYHTDIDFARAFMECREYVRFIPVAVGWNEELELTAPVRQLLIPWEMIEREARDRGSYMLLLYLRDQISMDLGKQKNVTIKPGYHIYVGSAGINLTKRVNRHYRIRKEEHWHIDELRRHAKIITHFPVRSSRRLECDIARAIVSISHSSVPGFGSSDCACRSHLFRFEKNPLYLQEFMKILQYYRIDSLMP